MSVHNRTHNLTRYLAHMNLSNHPDSRTRPVTLLSGMTIMALLLQITEHLTEYLKNKPDLFSLCQCSRDFWKLLALQMFRIRLLCLARVTHASHLIPETLLAVETQMSLAAVSKQFYNHALLHWTTQILDQQRLQQLRLVFVYHLDADLFARDELCMACNIAVVTFHDEADRRFYRQSGICRDCRTSLRSAQSAADQMRQCVQLNDAGLAIAEEWLQICQAQRCMRFADPTEFELAKLQAARQIDMLDPFR